MTIQIETKRLAINVKQHKLWYSKSSWKENGKDKHNSDENQVGN